MSDTVVGAQGTTLEEVRARMSRAISSMGQGIRAFPARVKNAMVRAGRWSWMKLRNLYRNTVAALRFTGDKIVAGAAMVGDGALRVIGGSGWLLTQAVSWVFNVVRLFSVAYFVGAVIWAVGIGLVVNWIGDKTARYVIRYPQTYFAWLGVGRPGTFREYTLQRADRREFTEPARDLYASFLRSTVDKGTESVFDASTKARLEDEMIDYTDVHGVRRTKSRAKAAEQMLKFSEPDRDYLNQYEELSLPEILAHHVEQLEHSIVHDQPDAAYWAARAWALDRVIRHPEELEQLKRDSSISFFAQNQNILDLEEHYQEIDPGYDMASDVGDAMEEEAKAIKDKLGYEALKTPAPAKKAAASRKSQS